MRISLSKEAKKYLICYFLYSIFFLIISLMDSERQLSNYLGTMAIPALMIVISDQSKQINLNYKHVYIAFIISSIIYAIWCNLSFFTSYELWSSSSTYTFSQKNSVGQILGFAFLAIIYFSKHINNKIKILAYIVAIYLLLIIAICRCRTALIGIAIATTAYIISKAKHKTITIITLIITTAIILSVPATSIFIDKVFLISKYNNTDINAFSSGRIDLWSAALKTFSNSPIVGIGNYYVDCSYIMILAESGLIGFFLIEYIWLSRIKANLNSRNSFLLAITIFYIVESVLEGLPPFGPGVSAFMFWLTSEKICENTAKRKRQKRIVEKEAYE